MASEQFSLCWDNFHKNMSMGMQSLLETEDLVDVTLAVEGRYLKAHKMVLSVCSPYFRELFQSNPCKHPIVFMKDVSYIALSDLLHFMYQGEVQVAQENLSTFIKTAEALQIKGLTGDSGVQNDSENEQEVISRETTEKRSHESSEQNSISTGRPKRFSGPASKRPKFSNAPTACSTPSPAPSLTTINKYEVTSVNTTQASDDVNLKMEPVENSEHAQADVGVENQLEQYADDTTTFEMTDETEDFSLMESGNEDPKPGTSTEGGDNQGLFKFIIHKNGTHDLILHQHIYRVLKVLNGKTLWVCAYYDDCPAKCYTTNGKIHSKIGTHYHLPPKKMLVMKEKKGLIRYKKLD